MDQNIENTPNWSTLQKISFRFCFLFFMLFILIHNGVFPFLNFISTPLHKFLQQLVPWLAKHIFKLPYEITVFTNGSGDTTYDYLLVACILIASITGAIIWSILDRHRKHYQTLYYWLTTVMRFYVALVLIGYGLEKVVKIQFLSPDYRRLMQPYGESSPMGLAWTFFGFSKGYNMFMGIAEIASILLLFRRTVTFGAIITLMTTANVMAINYFYDVPVKIFATTLFLMTLFLLLKDTPILFRFFFKGQQVSLPVIIAPKFKSQWLKITVLCLKFLVIGYVLIFKSAQVLKSEKLYGDNAPKSKFYGLYTTNSFSIGNETPARAVADNTKWKQMFVDVNDYAEIQYNNGSKGVFRLQEDPGQRILHIFRASDQKIAYSLAYDFADSTNLRFNGLINGDSIFISMHKKKISDFPLMNRGFNWINEYPYNR